jgi:hypothetical protein
MLQQPLSIIDYCLLNFFGQETPPSFYSEIYRIASMAILTTHCSQLRHPFGGSIFWPAQSTPPSAAGKYASKNIWNFASCDCYSSKVFMEPVSCQQIFL